MLGKFVRVKVVNEIDSTDDKGNYYGLNHGLVRYENSFVKRTYNAFIIGMDHPVFVFDGRVIATFRKYDKTYLVVAPAKRKFINHQIEDSLSFLGKIYSLRCLYEISCGAIVYKETPSGPKFILIKNKRSTHWSFPKGHVERGETYEQTAKREVLEETGLDIKILNGFREISEHKILKKIEKSVYIYVAAAKNKDVHIQKSEVEKYGWFSYDDALRRLKFQNDKKILKSAREFLDDKINFLEEEIAN
ncbi:MAG: NUDIX domain-containing protein [Clostridia bacterium]|nr:NUDIX domain-containing protein [Clostridia bacterium]